VSPASSLCACGARIPKRGRCAKRERERNAQPHRRAHRTARHRKLRAYVFLRDGFACVDCGATTDLTLDYIVPLQHGGEQCEANAVTRCRTHNSAKGTRRFFSTPRREPLPRFSRKTLSNVGETG
jgi:5-methylcytosine-specific restriction endonuclease McrA